MLSASMSKVNATAQRAPPGHGGGLVIMASFREVDGGGPRALGYAESSHRRPFRMGSDIVHGNT